jgi:hypothetical protein
VSDSRPIVCVDVNGALDMYTGWKDASHWDPPRDGAGDFLAQLSARGFRVVVFTTRYADDVWAWLRKHGLDACVAEVTDPQGARARVRGRPRCGSRGTSRRPCVGLDERGAGAQPLVRQHSSIDNHGARRSEGEQARQRPAQPDVTHDVHRGAGGLQRSNRDRQLDLLEAAGRSGRSQRKPRHVRAG